MYFIITVSNVTYPRSVRIITLFRENDKFHFHCFHHIFNENRVCSVVAFPLVIETLDYIFSGTLALSCDVWSIGTK